VQEDGQQKEGGSKEEGRQGADVLKKEREKELTFIHQTNL